MRESIPMAPTRSFDGYGQIPDASALAKNKGRNVLLQFGNKGAYYCESLSRVFREDKSVKQVLEANYIFVTIDWTKVQDDTVDSRYGVRRPWGAPWLVILDGAGNRLTTQDTSAFEEGDSHSPQKLLAFLEKWKPKDQ